jgi:hypothetical protein
MKIAIGKTVQLVSVAFAVALFLAPLAGAREIATVKIPLKAELYAADPQPLTTTQCGQCHEAHFRNLKNSGGKHRFDCRECHQSFHAYNPTKGAQAYQALMPKCANCHDLPHGKAVTDCASCHTDPHAIKKMVTGTRLANACGNCHAGPQAELAANPSKHTQVACSKCHTSHGFKPSCNMCHQPHYPQQGFDTCGKCHPVHKPKLVTYGSETQNVACVPCHANIAGKLQKSPSKHAAVACASCHKDKHKYVPKCTECHQAPHPQALLDRFPTCLTCHMDPHDLPMMKK